MKLLVAVCCQEDFVHGPVAGPDAEMAAKKCQEVLRQHCEENPDNLVLLINDYHEHNQFKGKADYDPSGAFESSKPHAIAGMPGTANFGDFREIRASAVSPFDEDADDMAGFFEIGKSNFGATSIPEVMDNLVGFKSGINDSSYTLEEVKFIGFSTSTDLAYNATLIKAWIDAYMPVSCVIYQDACGDKCWLFHQEAIRQLRNMGFKIV